METPGGDRVLNSLLALTQWYAARGAHQMTYPYHGEEAQLRWLIDELNSIWVGVRFTGKRQGGFVAGEMALSWTKWQSSVPLVNRCTNVGGMGNCPGRSFCLCQSRETERYKRDGYRARARARSREAPPLG